jgi:hypothetical protein
LLVGLFQLLAILPFLCGSPPPVLLAIFLLLVFVAQQMVVGISLLLLQVRRQQLHGIRHFHDKAWIRLQQLDHLQSIISFLPPLIFSLLFPLYLGIGCSLCCQFTFLNYICMELGNYSF